MTVRKGLLDRSWPKAMAVRLLAETRKLYRRLRLENMT